MRVLFPGSFDPFTVGHLDIAVRAAAMFGECVVGVACETEKKRSPLNLRLDLAKKSLQHTGIIVESYTGLTTDFAKKIGADAIIRGLRNQRDFAYEKKLHSLYTKDTDIKIVYLLASSGVSSDAVRKRVRDGKPIDALVPHSILHDVLMLYKQ